MELPSPVVRSDYLFRTYWLYWRLLCFEGDFPLRIVLDILISFFVTFWCPTHLIIGLFSERSLANIFRNLPITASSFCSSFKFICFRWKLWEIKKIERLFTELDQRAVSEEERLYFDRKTRKESEIIWKSVLIAYGSANLAANLTVLITNALIPAWFPYDVNGSAFNHWLSILYQSISGGLSTLENLANDSYTPMAFCVLAGHVRLLGMRLSRMGYDRDRSSIHISKQLAENIEDHKKLMKMVRLLRTTMYISQLGQFVNSGINIASVLIYILFFAESTFVSICYAVYFISMVLELFPSCYYGTLVTMEFNALPNAIFSSNWIGMDRKFIRDMVVFTEMMQLEVEVKAGGIIGIGMNAFFATVRMAYSYFALAMSFK